MSLDRIATPAKKVEKGVTLNDLMHTDKANWQYVSVPEENVLGEVHPNIRMNDEVFETGKTYLVPGAVADYVKDRLKAYSRGCMRIMSPKRDMDATNKVSVGSANAQAFGNTIQAVDPGTMGAQAGEVVFGG